MGDSPRRRYYDGGLLSRVRSIDDLRARTHRLMPRFALEYLEAGAGEEQSLARERASFAEWRVMPHTLVDESNRSVARAILGREAPLPLLVAPTGLNAVFTRHADLKLARAAAHAGVPFIQSTMSNDPMEDVAAVEGLRHWWQLYVFGEEAIWQDIVDRAGRAGCEALVLTTNAQIFGQRDWDDRARLSNGFPTPANMIDASLHPRWLATTLSHGMPRFGTVERYVPKDRRGFFDSARWIREQMPRTLSWDDAKKIRARWKRPLFVKGICNVEDAVRAREEGIDGIVLGTHGGRQADWAVAPLDILGPVRDAVGDAMHVYLSGGIRRGSDILKAIALGADAVLTGRATLYGLCAFGGAGVERAIAILRSEMRNELGQYGVPTLADIGRDILVHTDDLPL